MFGNYAENTWQQKAATNAFKVGFAEGLCMYIYTVLKIARY